jgi:hypothetical protein
MNLLVSQNVSRARQFDTLVQNTLETLRDPGIAADLGHVLTAELEQQLSHAFLPNERHGAFSLPRSEKQNLHTPIVPLTDEEFANSEGILQALYGTWRSFWPEAAIESDDFYGLRIGVDELHGVFDKLNNSQNNEDGAEKNDDAMDYTSLGAMTSSFHSRTTDRKRFESSRSVILVRDMVLGYSALAQAGVIIHEGIHAQDHQNYGPRAMSPRFIEATEARAYADSYPAFMRAPEESDEGKHAYMVAMNLSNENENAEHPYIPGPVTRQYMAEHGLF